MKKGRPKNKQTNKQIPVDMPQSLWIQGSILFTFSGNSLEHFGISDGFALLVDVNTEYDESQLGIFETPEGTCTKFAYQKFGFISLHNERECPIVFPAKDVKFIGVVAGFAPALDARFEVFPRYAERGDILNAEFLEVENA